MTVATKWQKARIIKILKPRHEKLRNRELWIVMQPPHEGNWIDVETNAVKSAPDPAYTSNLIAGLEHVAIGADSLELLPEFADDVTLIKWEDFIR